MKYLLPTYHFFSCLTHTSIPTNGQWFRQCNSVHFVYYFSAQIVLWASEVVLIPQNFPGLRPPAPHCAGGCAPRSLPQLPKLKN